VSKPKKTAADFPPGDWVPLKDALVRIIKITGSSDKGLFFLNRDLRKGRLRSAKVQILDGKEMVTWFKPSDWEQRNVEAPKVNPEEGVRVEPYEDGDFYVRAVDLEKHYPLAGTSAPSSDETRPPERRRGPVLKHEWHAIDGEIARRCIDPKTRLLKIPKSERKLSKAMLDWCQEKYKKEPAESEMREAVKAVCAALRVAYK
jgi:hypothetical protein